MNNKTKVCMGLLELIKQQDDIITKQNNIIAEIVNENAEKENIINELLKGEEYLY